MTTINATYSKNNVAIYIESSILDQLHQVLDVRQPYFIITDRNVGALYLNKIQKQLLSSKSYIIEPGEESKSYNQANEIIKYMLSESIGKETTIIALGGGVVGDLAGFVAGIYKRGIPYINIPTTLLAQVDSSIGGKTGVNIDHFKNQIGLIYHPQMVIIDPSVLATLPEKEFLNGYAEVIKYAFIKDAALYQMLKAKSYKLKDLILRSVIIKVEITTQDESDKNIRQILNFGHTIGHVIESLTNYQMSHGEAVALGMIYETINPIVKKELIELIKLYQLPTSYPDLKTETMINYLQTDKKRVGHNITIPIVEKIGQATLQTLPLLEWKEHII